MIFEYDNNLPEENFKFIELYHHDCDQKWKFEYVETLLDMTNEELFEEMLSKQLADDFDGGYTDEQQWKGNKTAEIVRTQLMPSHWNFLKEKNMSLYSSIETVIIEWTIRGDQTAGSLTREIMKILFLHDETPKISTKFRKARKKLDKLNVDLPQRDLIYLVKSLNTLTTEQEEYLVDVGLRDEQYSGFDFDIAPETFWVDSELERLTNEQLWDMYQKYK